MWRIFGSMGLMMFALLWSAVAIILVFILVPAAWETVFGHTSAVPAALLALAFVFWSAGKMMKLADRLMGDSSGRHAGRQPALATAEPDAHADWRSYAADIALSKRWAFYRRTQQFERLAELEAQLRRERSRRASAGAGES